MVLEMRGKLDEVNKDQLSEFGKKFLEIFSSTDDDNNLVTNEVDARVLDDGQSKLEAFL